MKLSQKLQMDVVSNQTKPNKLKFFSKTTKTSQILMKLSQKLQMDVATNQTKLHKIMKLLILEHVTIFLNHPVLPVPSSILKFSFESLSIVNAWFNEDEIMQYVYAYFCISSNLYLYRYLRNQTFSNKSMFRPFCVLANPCWWKLANHRP